MLEHVFLRAKGSGAQQVVIATDNEKVRQTAQCFGAEVVVTSDRHQSGTDRIAEVVNVLGWSDSDLVVNLQGDEPLMPADLINQVAANLAQCEEASIATLCQQINNEQEFHNPNVVKVVRDHAGLALYFSRAPIPYNRCETAGHYGFRHLGIYAYRVNFLKAFAHWQAVELEQLESLEQLRALTKGHRIHVGVADQPMPPGVDTIEDLQQVEILLLDKDNRI